MVQPSKEYMREWRKRNKDRARARKGRAGKTRHDAKDIRGLPKVSSIGGLTLKDWIGG